MTVAFGFRNFGQPASGRLVTHCGRWAVVNARNPHGSHNLVLVDDTTGDAVRHGTLPVVVAVAAWLDRRTLRRTLAFVNARRAPDQRVSVAA